MEHQLCGLNSYEHLLRFSLRKRNVISRDHTHWGVNKHWKGVSRRGDSKMLRTPDKGHHVGRTPAGEWNNAGVKPIHPGHSWTFQHDIAWAWTPVWPNDHGNPQSGHVFLQAHQVLEKKFFPLLWTISLIAEYDVFCLTQGIMVCGLLVLSRKSLQCQTDFVGPENMTWGRIVNSMSRFMCY